jgi:hypothetical protein
MRSSISNSEQELATSLDGAPPPVATGSNERQVRIATIVLIGTLVALLGVTELSARLLFPRASRIQRRIDKDRHDVNDIRKMDPRRLPVVLFLGNSLLLHGLDYSEIRTELAPNATVVRYAIENTEYLDWYYGMRRLFAAGIRPSRVVLCLNLGQLLSKRGLGDYSAYYLFAARDLLPTALEAGLNNTETSGLIFAHWSAFYASRGTIRNYLLNIADPSYAAALHILAQVPPAFPPQPEAITLSRIRLRALNELCRRNGSDFVFIVPPALSTEGNLLLKAGALEQVDIDAPIAMGTLGSEYFMDRFHLNEKGAAVFTQALSHDIRSRVNVPSVKGESDIR